MRYVIIILLFVACSQEKPYDYSVIPQKEWNSNIGKVTFDDTYMYVDGNPNNKYQIEGDTITFFTNTRKVVYQMTESNDTVYIDDMWLY